jgi:hypothetical protein
MGMPQLRDFQTYAETEILDLCSDLKRWDDSLSDEDAREFSIEILKKGLSNDDGYILAKYLEDEGWWPDSELVEILDGVCSGVKNSHRIAVANWWKSENKPVPEVGKTVTTRRGVGVVKSIDDKKACVTVFSEAAGHGIQKGGITSFGWYVPFEEIVDG